MEGYLRSKNPKVKKGRFTEPKDEVVEWNREQLRDGMVHIQKTKNPHDL